MSSSSEPVLSDNAESSSLETGDCSEFTETSTVPTAQTFGFDVQSRKTDLALVIEGKSVYVNRAVLELTSPVFQTLLDANEGKESLELVGPTYGDFVEFLACCYPGKTHSVTENNVFRVLPLAEKYAVSHLLSQCEVRLEAMLGSSSIAPGVLVSCVQAVCYYKFDKLKPKCEATLRMLVVNDVDKLNVLSLVPFGTTAEYYNMVMPLMTEKVQTYKYLTVGLSKQRQLKLAEWKTVKYFTVHMSNNVAGVYSYPDDVRVCGLEFRITSKVMHVPGLTKLDKIEFCLKCRNDNTLLTSCEGEVTFVVTNHILWKDHWIQSVQFKSSPSTNIKTLASVQELKDILFDDDEGYKVDNGLNVTAHVLLNTTMQS